MTLRLKYGLNPQQVHAEAATAGGGPLPFSVLAGTPSVVNLLDALQGWQLVRSARAALGVVVAASMKHVSPAGVAAAGPVDPVVRGMFRLDGADLSEPASAYARARACDPRSSYGDMVALSEPVDLPTARLLGRVISDGVIAPDYEPGAVAILARKKRGSYLVLRMDPDHVPPERETREVCGVRITQDRDPVTIDAGTLGPLPADALLGLITVRHTQSNAVALVLGGETIGIGAGQQSRVDCVRLAGEKADRWRLLRSLPVDLPPDLPVRDRVEHLLGMVDRLSPAERRTGLAGADRCTLASDAYLPFRDNVDVAAAHGVGRIVEGGGSRRGDEITAACAEHGIELVRTGLRLFYH